MPLICPVCRRADGLRGVSDSECMSCGRSYPSNNRFRSFLARPLTPDEETYRASYSPDRLGHRFVRKRARHYWDRGRLSAVDAMLSRAGVKPESRILDAGCGTGNVMDHLKARGFHPAGSDLYAEGLEVCAAQGHRELFQADLAALPFREEFDAVLLLDVIEHVDDDRGALRAAWDALKPGAHAIVTVPSYPSLFGRFDEADGHKRRYDRHGLKEKLSEAGFEVRWTSYFFCALFPVSYPVKAWEAWRFRRGKRFARAETAWENRTWPGVNEVLTWIVRLEANWLRLGRLPWGTSLLAIGRRNRSAGS